MKILVTYFSLSGNTRKIAESIKNELIQTNEVYLSPVDKIAPADLADYDFVFLGTPIHAGGIAAQVKNWLEAVSDHADFKLSSFITHASSAYSRQGFESGILQVEDICSQKKIAYLGCFDCQGRLAPELHDMVQKAQKVSDREWAEKMAECDKHPNVEDEENAREFARKIISLRNIGGLSVVANLFL